MVAKQKKSAVQNHCSTSAINSKKADTSNCIACSEL